MYVAMNVLGIPEEQKEKMAQMFSHAAESMKTVPGCLEFLFLDAVGENKQVVYTKWESQAAFEAWTRSDAFARAHSREATSASPAGSSTLEQYVVLHHS